MSVKAIPFTVGKSDRNDDFILSKSVFDACLLGVVGDFTSDSPPGWNLRLKKEIEQFLENRLQAWREHLMEPEKMIQVTADFANKWLAGRTPRAATTLNITVYDARSRQLHYLCVGDSGVGVAGPNGVRFLHMGNTSDDKDASGFLPLDGPFEVKREPLQPGEVVFSYTDGMWSNTKHFLHPDRDPEGCKAYLAEVFAPGRLQAVAVRIRQKIFNRANRLLDDFTMLVMVEEQTANQPQTNPTANPQLPDSLNYVVEQKVDEALDRKLVRPLLSKELTPMEQEFLDVLKQTAGSFAEQEKKLKYDILKLIKKEIKADLNKEKSPLSKRIQEAVKEALKEEIKKEKTESGLTRLFAKKPVSADYEEKFKILEQKVALLKKMAVSEDHERVSREITPQNESSITPISEEETIPLAHQPDHTQKHGVHQEPTVDHTKERLKALWVKVMPWVLVAIIATPIFFFVYTLMRPNWEVSSEQDSNPGIDHNTPNENPKQPDETVETTTAITPPTNPSSDYEKAKQKIVNKDVLNELLAVETKLKTIQPRNDFLKLLDVESATFQEEILCLGLTLVQNKAELVKKITKNELNPIFLPAMCEVNGSHGFRLNLNYGKWVNVPSLAAKAKEICGLWLQIRLGADEPDGDWGPGTTNLCRDFLKDIDLPGFILLWDLYDREKGTLTIGPQDADFAARMAARLGLSEKQYRESLANFARDFSSGIGEQESVHYRAQMSTIHAILKKNNQPTALGSWVRKAQAATEGIPVEEPIFLLWLSKLAGLPQSDGTFATLNQELENRLRATNTMALFETVKKEWSQL